MLVCDVYAVWYVCCFLWCVVVSAGFLLVAGWCLFGYDVGMFLSAFWDWLAVSCCAGWDFDGILLWMGKVLVEC